MKTALLCVACFAVGAFSVGVPLLLMLTYRPRYVAPTLRRRLPPTHQEPPTVKPTRDATDWDVAQEPNEPIYMYGVTGEER
jgi:hypothetical protein